MIVYAPAKLNLCLRVLGKRKDGYHNIETIFEKVALFDKIVIRSLKNGKIKIFSNHPDVPVGKESLIQRTIDLLKVKREVSSGVEAKIFKRIPIASGLGGASSDAASVLRALNKLWKLSLDLPELVGIGKKLGADIPFFLNKTSFAIGKERGDEIAPLGWKIKLWHLLISMPVKVLSKDIYSAYKGTRKGTAPIFSIEEIVKNGRCPYNDLEETIFKKVPLLARLKNTLKDMGMTYSLVSGSGPSVFSLFQKRKEAYRAKELLVERFPIVKDKGWQIFIVPTL